MSLSAFIAGVCFLAMLAYTFLGFVTQATTGQMKWAETAEVFGMCVAVSAFVAAIIFLLIRFIRKKAGQPTEPDYHASRVVGWMSVTVIAAAGVGGIWTAYSQGAEKRAYAATVKAKAAERAAAERAEQARQAALTPEQRAAEAAQRQARVDAAAQAASARAAAAAQAVALEKEAAAKKQAAAAAEGAKMQLAAAGAAALKQAMKDPEAFVLTSLVLQPSGAACYDYRAKNSFGAVLPSSAVLTSKGKMLTQEGDGNRFVGAWNAECTKAGGRDLTSLLKQLGIV